MTKAGEERATQPSTSQACSRGGKPPGSTLTTSAASRNPQYVSQPFNAITTACTAVPRVARPPAANWPAAGPSAP
ncbi:hypothetical protein CFE70_001732 [Pyrenophora teres f. teres 0-1]